MIKFYAGPNLGLVQLDGQEILDYKYFMFFVTNLDYV